MGKRRRFWSDEEKRRIVAQARLAEVSVSEVARRYDVNANLVFTWLRDPRFAAEADAPAFLPVTVSAERLLWPLPKKAPRSPSAPEVRIVWTLWPTKLKVPDIYSFLLTSARQRELRPFMKT